MTHVLQTHIHSWSRMLIVVYLTIAFTDADWNVEDIWLNTLLKAVSECIIWYNISQIYGSSDIYNERQ